MAQRIARSPHDLSQQCSRASAAIADAGAAWPPSAPTGLRMGEVGGAISLLAGQIVAAQAHLSALRQQMREALGAARAEMARVDHATDLLYGPGGAQKMGFGLAPKKTTRTRAGAPGQVVIRRVGDGTLPASLVVDFDRVELSAYEVQWFADAPLTQMVGSATATASAFEIAGLMPGRQYWIRVRAVRAGMVGPWSDQATRVANI